MLVRDRAVDKCRLVSERFGVFYVSGWVRVGFLAVGLRPYVSVDWV
jgi:hypothetical protein